MLRALGHVGFWNGLYAAAALVCLFQLSGISPSPIPRWEAIASVLATATAVYALDRVKFRDSWIDPADIAAQPARYRFLTSHSGAVRAGAVALLLAAALVGFRITAWALVVPPVAALGIGLYAPRPRLKAPRIKDILWLKNLYVAAGMTMYLCAVVFAIAPRADTLKSLLPATAWLLARIILDAALCDLDDELTDKQFGTATLPTRIGRTRSLAVTLVARMGLLLAMLTVPAWLWPARIAWTISLILGTLILRLPRWDRLRDLVDLRFLGEAILATAILMCWPTHT